MSYSKYYNWLTNSNIDPRIDGCDYLDWKKLYTSFPFSVHKNGFLVFLTPEELSESDEYTEDDPYSVENNIESEFQQNRINCTLELVESVMKGNKSGAKILDLGCGEGHLTAQIHEKYPSSEMSGLDYSLSAINYAATQFNAIDFVVASAYSPPYRESYFDLVVCNNIWEHVPDPLFMLKKIYKILKPGGHIIVSTPSRYRLENLIRVLRGKRVNFMSKLHVTEYTVGQVKEQLRYGNFETVTIYSRAISIKPITLKAKVRHKILAPLLRSYLKKVHSHHSIEQTVFYLAKKI